MTNLEKLDYLYEVNTPITELLVTIIELINNKLYEEMELLESCYSKYSDKDNLIELPHQVIVGDVGMIRHDYAQKLLQEIVQEIRLVGEEHIFIMRCG